MTTFKQQELFIGVTCWNSALFLGACLKAIERTTDGIDKTVVVFDNQSTDASVEIAKQHGAQVIVDTKTQPDALNLLLDISNAKYTLLIHSDTILLSPNWFDVCSNNINQRFALVSPEDIGCGPMTRTYGKDKPESSFLFFDTAVAKSLRKLKVTRRRFRIPLRVEKQLDFYAPHITYNLPNSLARAGKDWQAMSVLYSNLKQQPVYFPENTDTFDWQPILAHLEYGLGNFYALDGTITHYHNWYDRVENKAGALGLESTEPDNKGFPISFVREYSAKFLADYNNGSVQLPRYPQTPINEAADSINITS